MFRFLHAADFHLDSAFAALPPRQAAARRREARELPARLADWANAHDIALVLLSGDLLDSGSCYRETREALRDALGRISAPVFLAPGNHDSPFSGKTDSGEERAADESLAFPASL